MGRIETNLRENLVKQLEDLSNKIKNNEPLPDGNQQDINFLVEISDRIDECLNCWYY